MNVLEFAAPGGPVRVERGDGRGEAGELLVLAQPPVYQRVLASRLFGLVPQYLPEISPLVADRPVWLSLRWHGNGPRPDSLDELTGPALDSASWQLTSVTQDFDDVRLGYRTVGPDDELGLAVLDVLAAEGWTAYRTAPDEPIRSSYEGVNGTLEVAVHTDEYQRFLVVLAELPVTLTPERIAAAGELALRLSALMDIATVDVDLDDGSVRLRNSVDFGGAPILAPLVRNTLLGAVQQGDMFLPAFAAVAEGCPPVDAVDIAVPVA